MGLFFSPDASFYLICQRVKKPIPPYFEKAGRRYLSLCCMVYLSLLSFCRVNFFIPCLPFCCFVLCFLGFVCCFGGFGFFGFFFFCGLGVCSGVVLGETYLVSSIIPPPFIFPSAFGTFQSVLSRASFPTLSKASPRLRSSPQKYKER